MTHNARKLAAHAAGYLVDVSFVLCWVSGSLDRAARALNQASLTAYLAVGEAWLRDAHMKIPEATR